RTAIDRVAAIEPRQTDLGKVLEKLVVRESAPRSLEPEPDQPQAGTAILHPGERLDPFCYSLPLVLVMQHKHAHEAVGRLDGNRMEQRGIHRRDDNLSMAAEAARHDFAEPGGDHDLRERQPVGRVDTIRRAVIEALVVLDEIELAAAAN